LTKTDRFLMAVLERSAKYTPWICVHFRPRVFTASINVRSCLSAPF
jgi:hypothetical protein